MNSTSPSGPAGLSTALETLFETGLFLALPRPEGERLANLGTIQSVPRGHQLTAQGRPEDRLTVVLSGTLAVSRYRHGNRSQVGVLRKGATIGVMHLIDPHPACADIVVVDGHATVWSAPDAAVQALLSADSAAGFIILQALGRQLCRRTRADRNDLWRHLEATQAYFRNMDL